MKKFAAMLADSLLLVAVSVSTITDDTTSNTDSGTITADTCASGHKWGGGKETKVPSVPPRAWLRAAIVLPVDRFRPSRKESP